MTDKFANGLIPVYERHFAEYKTKPIHLLEIGVLAGLSLVTSMISTIAGTGALTGSMVGTIQMAANLAGLGDITGSLGMLSGMVANLAGQGLISSDLKGKLFMEAQIYVNEGQATVDQIVEGVVDNLGTITATVPPMLNTETGDIIMPLD